MYHLRAAEQFSSGNRTPLLSHGVRAQLLEEVSTLLLRERVWQGIRGLRHHRGLRDGLESLLVRHL